MGDQTPQLPAVWCDGLICFPIATLNTSAAHSLLIKIPLFYLSQDGKDITEGSLATVFGLIAGQITTRKNAQ